MSAKRKSIPKRTRMLEKTRRLAAGLWRDITIGEPTTGKGAPKANPWARCETCSRRQPPSAFGCDEPTHRGMCAVCCGAPHEAPARHEHDVDEEDDAR